MKMRLRLVAAAAPLLALAACGSGDSDQPGGISADEAQELNEAAEMLDPDAVDANALPPAGNGT
ncbi:hypothetical protein [Sphingomonas sp.]|uniref:hypothetical protein n=1 Tax=Sphingomonas sp. TaxID=28214 RepID=UPI002DD6B17F|nr:hypothetical protein [Sphingomonas sp.]